MTYEELLLKTVSSGDTSTSMALRAVAELHRPDPKNPRYCEAEDGWVAWNEHPCETIRVIESYL
jgi:hypothetical protein